MRCILAIVLQEYRGIVLGFDARSALALSGNNGSKTDLYEIFDWVIYCIVIELRMQVLAGSNGVCEAT